MRAYYEAPPKESSRLGALIAIDTRSRPNTRVRSHMRALRPPALHGSALPRVTAIRNGYRMGAGNPNKHSGPKLPALVRRPAEDVDKILRGAKPGDLPVSSRPNSILASISPPRR